MKVRVARSEEKVYESLWKNSDYFVNTLGQPTRDGLALVFAGREHPLGGLRVRYVEERKFLGKIYATVVEGRVANTGRVREKQKVELQYAGFFLKGMPFFKPVRGKGTSPEKSVLLANRLNGDKFLLDACRGLDLEFLRVFYDGQEEAWKIQMRPYGGSMVCLMFPPMSYNVALPKGHGEKIICVMRRIADLLQGNA